VDKTGTHIYHVSTWTLEVDEDQITGTSEWDCCPGHRIDPLKGQIKDGNNVIIERDCKGQGWEGSCYQVYSGIIKDDTITGSYLSRTDSDSANALWRMYLK
jgi:hypothetical protein